MSRKLHIDFESRSAVNLLTQGAYVYAQSPTTQVTMMSFTFSFDDEVASLWLPRVLNESSHNAVVRILIEKGYQVFDTIFPEDVAKHIREGGDIFAFNAAFERLLFWHCLSKTHPDIPKPTIEQMYCVATQARANNMPGNLDGCTKALKCGQLKKKEGTDLIKLLCIPYGVDDNDGEYLFNEGVDDYVAMGEYCIQDTNAERAACHSMRGLTDVERDDYTASELINDRGLLVDVELAHAATKYAAEEQQDLLDEVARLTLNKDTGEYCSKVRGTQIRDWVYDRLTDDQKQHMHKVDTKTKAHKITLDKNARAKITDDSTVDRLVAQVVEYCDLAQASSTGKFKSMLLRAHPITNRVCGAYVLFGASTTHRYSSKGLQMHNLPRDTLDEDVALKVRTAMIAGASAEHVCELSGYNMMQTLKRLLRYSIKAAPGKTFVCADLGQIEGRGLPWLSLNISARCDNAATAKLDQYRNQTKERDVYCAQGSVIYGKDVYRDGSKDMELLRQIGKVSELSLLFGGGEGAFEGMAANYGVYLPRDQTTEIKEGWRAGNIFAPIFWKALHRAAIRAVRNPNTPYQAGRITYLFQEGVMHGTLWCLLPSGNLLAYPKARVHQVEGPYGTSPVLTALKGSWSPKAGVNEWPRVTLWPGLMAENVTQAVCAFIQREAISALIFERNAPVVGHTHDEILLEVDTKDVDFWVDVLIQDMTTNYDWSEGLPLVADEWVGRHFRK